MKLTAGQAAKHTGKSVPTITRAINNGRISAEKLPDGGGYLIDASELFRVFPAITRNSVDETSSLESEIPNEPRPLQVEVEVLRERLLVLEEERERERSQLERERSQLASQIEDLKRDRDHWREQADRTTKLLPAPVEPPHFAPVVNAETPKRRWWSFGKAKS